MKRLNPKNLLIPRVPKENWPKPQKIREIAHYTEDGRFVELIFPNQKYPWGLYEQSGHAGFGIVLAETPKGLRVALVRQWRPTDKDSLSIPAGNIGLAPEKMFLGFLREVQEEIGTLEIISLKTCQGFSHSQARETVPGGGPKCFFPFIVKVKAPAVPKKFKKDDEKTFSHWYTIPQVRKLVKTRKISDMASCFFLLAAGIIESGDFGWEEI